MTLLPNVLNLSGLPGPRLLPLSFFAVGVAHIDTYAYFEFEFNALVAAQGKSRRPPARLNGALSWHGFRQSRRRGADGAVVSPRQTPDVRVNA